jgi:hypothetical protein
LSTSSSDRHHPTISDAVSATTNINHTTSITGAAFANGNANVAA